MKEERVSVTQRSQYCSRQSFHANAEEIPRSSRQNGNDTEQVAYMCFFIFSLFLYNIMNSLCGLNVFFYTCVIPHWECSITEYGKSSTLFILNALAQQRIALGEIRSWDL